MTTLSGSWFDRLTTNGKSYRTPPDLLEHPLDDRHADRLFEPALESIGFAPAVTFLIPSALIAWARTAVVVVPSRT
jgi:hypothetical protein